MVAVCRPTPIWSHFRCLPSFGLAESCAGSLRAASSSGRQPPKVLIQPLPPFLNKNFPGPEPRVAAFLLENAINLRRLKQRLVDLECPTVMWQGQVLFCSSS